MCGWHGHASCLDGVRCIERSGVGDVPITLLIWTLTASCTACVDVLRPASFTVILGE
jgi:hypothetical protein